ncbi:substrate-binding periplasmic protein [Desulfocurvus sp. DL9XJH121]
MKAVCTLLLALAFLLQGQQPSAAEPGKGMDAPLVLGCPATGWPPYHIPDAPDRRPGILPDIFREACGALGQPAELRPLPEVRAMIGLNEGTINVYTKAKEWVADPGRFLWSSTVMRSTDVLLFRAGEEFPFRDVADLRGKSLGTVHGFHYPTLEALFDSGAAARVDAPSTRKLFQMLQAGRCDAAVINDHVARWIISRDPDLAPEQFSLSKTAVDSADYRFVFSWHRTWGGFIEDLDREIARMRADGRMDAIEARYR